MADDILATRPSRKRLLALDPSEQDDLSLGTMDIPALPSAAPAAQPPPQSTTPPQVSGMSDEFQAWAQDAKSKYKMGPIDPKTGKFLDGEFKGQTTEEARNRVMADYNAERTPGVTPGSGENGGLRTGSLTTSSLTGGNGLSPESSWRATFGPKKEQQPFKVSGTLSPDKMRTIDTGATPFDMRGQRRLTTNDGPQIEYDPSRDTGMNFIPGDSSLLPRGADRGVVINPRYVAPGADNIGYARTVPATPPSAITSARTAPQPQPTTVLDKVGKAPAPGRSGSSETAIAMSEPERPAPAATRSGSSPTAVAMTTPPAPPRPSYERTTDTGETVDARDPNEARKLSLGDQFSTMRERVNPRYKPEPPNTKPFYGTTGVGDAFMKGNLTAVGQHIGANLRTAAGVASDAMQGTAAEDSVADRTLRRFSSRKQMFAGQ